MRRYAIVAGGVLLALATGFALARQQEEPEPGLKELAEQRVAIARRLIAEAEQTWLAPPQERPAASAAGVVQRVGMLSRRLMEAEFDQDPTPAGRAAAIDAHIARLERWVVPLTGMMRAASSGISQRDVDELSLDLLEARAERIRVRDGARPDEPDRGPR